MLKLNSGKDFILYKGIKDHFDHFIALQKTENKALLETAYKTYLLQTELTVLGQKQAADLFSRYVQYKHDLLRLEAETPIPQGSLVEAAQRRLLLLDELRWRWFGSTEYQFLFADERQFDEAALNRLAIRQNSQLTREQKEQRLEQHFANLSEPEKEGLQPSLDLIRSRSIRQLPQGNQYNLLAAEFGDEIAGRMIKAWKNQTDWQKRVQAFVVKKERILSDPGLDKLQKTLLIAELEESGFSQYEKKRLKVFIENPELMVTGG
ncbi:lipase chaperone [Endozoicomonas gorgoniicola]|uniref:Lipase chaperone n=1 Tax=Endozoicomonas gorgoniicola TaxID=1234144 RepID=A0ABT3MU04_9GAMM|nr:lipase chaperone [Endozoicomonas gorgoniicola]MCW7552464.1 lipase chaperone [Endozoicomonas gorgoniicola]